jgi:hypothetical protein
MGQDQIVARNLLELSLKLNNNEKEILKLETIVKHLTDVQEIDPKTLDIEWKKNLITKLNFIRYWTSKHILLSDQILKFLAYGRKEEIRAWIKTAFKLGLFIPKRQLIRLIKRELSMKICSTNAEMPDLLGLIIKNITYDPLGVSNEQKIGQIKNLNYNVPKIEKTPNQNYKIDQLQTQALNKNAPIWKRSNEIKSNCNLYTIFEQGTRNKIINKHVLNYRIKCKDYIVDTFKNLKKYIIPKVGKDNIISLSTKIYLSERFDSKGRNKVPADIVITKEELSDDFIYHKYYYNEYNWYIYKGIEFNIETNAAKIGIWTIGIDINWNSEENTLYIPHCWNIVQKNSEFNTIVAGDLFINRNKTKRNLRKLFKNNPHIQFIKTK